MQNHWFVSKFDKWLWDAEGEWPEPSTEPSNKDKCLHLEIPIFLLINRSQLRIREKRWNILHSIHLTKVFYTPKEIHILLF